MDGEARSGMVEAASRYGGAMPDIQLPASVDAPLIVHGDCIEVLRRFPAESVHVIVTDPPAGIGFMGKGWDSFADYKPQTPRGIEAALAFAGLLEPWARGFVVFMVDVWTECMRVLKPGGHICAWALPKTADLAGLALRLAGLDMRDSLAHLFGSGMPHGQDISKAIDKAAGAEREVVETIPDRWAGKGISLARANEQPKDSVNITAPATPDAERWHDWNTQLAPGHEQWLLARKPSPLTYAATAVEHGTGALNIGACRVPRGERPAREAIGGLARTTYDTGGQARGGSRSAGSTDLGGWPSNVLLSHSPDCGERCVDGCQVLELDRQSGVAAAKSERVGRRGGRGFGLFDHEKSAAAHGVWPADGGGGASRFFPTFRYQAKASRRDIPGRSDLTISHPTHKHPDLMRWLVRLLASPDAIVLDPFAGSGTTGVACVAEGFRFIGIELNQDSVVQARARLAAAVGSPDDAAAANTIAPVGAQLGLL